MPADLATVGGAWHRHANGTACRADHTGASFFLSGSVLERVDVESFDNGTLQLRARRAATRVLERVLARWRAAARRPIEAQSEGWPRWSDGGSP
jgi:hypothetical protein